MLKQFLRVTLLGFTGLTSGVLLMLACSDDGGSDDEGGSSQAFCDRTCESDMDCNPGGAGDATCVDNFCDFPDIEPTECDPNNMDPLDPLSCGGVPDNCRPVDAFLTCVIPCMADADCGVAALECTGTDDNGNSFCLPVPFSCTPGEACDGGLGVCNAAGDACTCTSDADCTAQGTACHMF
jgi:hypothetical protein